MRFEGKLILANYYEVSEQCRKEGKIVADLAVNIARKDMNGVNDKFIELAPSKELFSWYMKNKNNKDWFSDYKKVYMNQLKDNKEALNKLSMIRKALDDGKDVMLLCFCRNVNACHRSILGDMFKSKGYEVIYK